MFCKLHRIAALLALLLFGLAQYQGWDLFDDTAGSHSGSHGGSRIYHK